MIPTEITVLPKPLLRAVHPNWNNTSNICLKYIFLNTLILTDLWIMHFGTEKHYAATRCGHTYRCSANPLISIEILTGNLHEVEKYPHADFATGSSWIRCIDQQKAACFKSDFCVSCFIHHSTSDNKTPLLFTQFHQKYANPSLRI